MWIKETWQEESVSKSPAFQFYPKDWLSSQRVAAMSSAQKGVYIDLLCHAWLADDCGLPDDDKVLLRLSKADHRKGAKLIQ